MTDTERTDKPRSATYLLLGALGLLLIPVVVGFVMANTGGGGEDESGMGSSGIADTATSADGFPVRPISEILVGDFAVEVDPSGTSAVLRLTTTIDVACSVVYGPDTDFGGLATDTDMAGGGHRDHQPLMTGLVPGSTVYFRVQGASADGTIYVGDVETFVTPGAGNATAAVNLALDATVTDVSSEFSDAFAAGNAIDGSLGTEWSSRGDGNDAYIVIELGASTDVTGFGFRTREMTDGTSITNTYTVTIDDGETFGPFEAGPGLTVTEFAATGRVFRFDMEDTTGGNTGAVEIEIYGD
jgi:hypothetical protein